MGNAVEINIKNGYSVNFYSINNEVIMEVTNRQGVIIGETKLTSDKLESLKELIE